MPMPSSNTPAGAPERISGWIGDILSYAAIAILLWSLIGKWV